MTLHACAASDATCIQIAKCYVVYNNVYNHCTLLLLQGGGQCWWWEGYHMNWYCNWWVTIIVSPVLCDKMISHFGFRFYWWCASESASTTAENWLVHTDRNNLKLSTIIITTPQLIIMHINIIDYDKAKENWSVSQNNRKICMPMPMNDTYNTTIMFMIIALSCSCPGVRWWSVLVMRRLSHVLILVSYYHCVTSTVCRIQCRISYHQI